MIETLIILALVVYFLPTLLGMLLRVPGVWLIFLVNLVFGWTIAGWAVALFWVFKQVRGRREPERVIYVRDRDDDYYPRNARRVN